MKDQVIKALESCISLIKQTWKDEEPLKTYYVDFEPVTVQARNQVEADEKADAILLKGTAIAIAQVTEAD